MALSVLKSGVHHQRPTPFLCVGRQHTGGPKRLDVIPEFPPSFGLVEGAGTVLVGQRLDPGVKELAVSFEGVGNSLLVGLCRRGLGRCGPRLCEARQHLGTVDLGLWFRRGDAVHDV
jgi:hypothetical protein